MTPEEAKALRSFNHFCLCGGYTRSVYGMANQPVAQPHMVWCPQFKEYGEWYRAMHPEPCETARDDVNRA